MAVYRRGRKWWYELEVDGKRHRRPCVGCENEAQAEAYARKQRALLLQLSQQKTARALVENFRNVLTGGRRVMLSEAYELAEAKPTRRSPGTVWAKQKRRSWQDFAAFMADKHPDAVAVSDVTRLMAEEYISHLRSNGRYVRAIQEGCGRHEYVNKVRALAPKTVNEIQTILTQVFDLIQEDAGLLDNPFASIPKQANRSETREAFTPEELSRILRSDDDFVRPLFLMAVMTGLREGDICRLRWSEVNLSEGMIRREQHKTDNDVAIPIMPQLYAYLSGLKRDGEYVLPDQAEVYRRSPCSVSVRIKKFLRKLKIVNSKSVAGRDRRVSVKDLHSCRHTFCWLAGMAGIPMPTVQAIAGHMSPEMTAHYAAHVQDQQKTEQMAILSEWFAENIMGAAQSEDALRRKELVELAQACPDECLEQAIAALRSLSSLG